MNKFLVTAQAGFSADGKLKASHMLRSPTRPVEGGTLLLPDGIEAEVLSVNRTSLNTEVKVTPTELEHLISSGWDALAPAR